MLDKLWEPTKWDPHDSWLLTITIFYVFCFLLTFCVSYSSITKLRGDLFINNLMKVIHHPQNSLNWRCIFTTIYLWSPFDDSTHRLFLSLPLTCWCILLITIPILLTILPSWMAWPCWPDRNWPIHPPVTSNTFENSLKPTKKCIKLLPLGRPAPPSIIFLLEHPAGGTTSSDHLIPLENMPPNCACFFHFLLPVN